MNLQESLTAYRAEKNDLVERMRGITARAAEAGCTFDLDQQKEVDELTTKIGTLDAHIKRVETVIAYDAPVTPAGDTAPVAAISTPASKSAHAFMRKSDPDDKFEGQSFVRKCIAQAEAMKSQTGENPAVVAQRRWGRTNPQLVEVIKAGVQGGSSSGSWGEELVTTDNRYMGDFINYLTATTVYDRLPLREAPSNVRIKAQDGIGTAYWVGEGAAIPATSMGFNDMLLTPLKVGALAVVTNEMLRDSSPSAEQFIRDSLVENSREKIDQTFISAAAAVPGQSPAGILNDVAGTAASGSTIDNMRTDLKTLYAPFIAAKNASGLHIVMDKSLALSVSLIRNALGQAEEGALTEEGGTLGGRPVVTGDHVPAGNMILLKPSDIYRIDGAGVQVSVSNEATIEQDNAPTGHARTPTAASANMVNMFQAESTAFKIVRPINFALRRAGVVQLITGAAYE